MVSYVIEDLWVVSIEDAAGIYRVCGRAGGGERSFHRRRSCVWRRRGGRDGGIGDEAAV